MWYNTQMKAKPPRNYSSKLRNNFQSSLGKEIVNPRERLMNTQKQKIHLYQIMTHKKM